MAIISVKMMSTTCKCFSEGFFEYNYGEIDFVEFTFFLRCFIYEDIQASPTVTLKLNRRTSPRQHDVVF